MSTLTEATFTERVAAGCTACGAKKLVIRSYVEGKFALLGGEPTGAVTWAYKGETFVDGIFEIACAACPQILFADARCPRCHADGGLARALDTENTRPVPRVCVSCNAESLSYRAMTPVAVTYEGQRAGKAKPRVGLYDEGFHGLRADCARCGPALPDDEACPLCDAPGPLRALPS